MSEREKKLALTHDYGTIYGLEEAKAIIEVLAKGAPTYGYGTRGQEFEKALAKYSGAKHAIVVSSCAAALHLSAIALGIKGEDEVIVPSLTFSASANVFAFQGAKIVFVDSNERTFNLDSHTIEKKITNKTKAIIAVHMCGQPCDMDPIMEIAKKYHLVVIEDAAHAIGAEYKRRKVGILGDIACFSFHNCKNMSTLGEGGAITTNNDEWAEIMSLYSRHGGKYAGLNYRMTEIQSAVGLIQLKKLDKHNQIRRTLSHYLTKKLEGIKALIPPYESKEVKHVYHLYNMLIKKGIAGMDRDTFIKRMAQEGIKCIIQYCPPVHLKEAYQRLGHKKGECPIAEDLSSRIVTLPMGPRLTVEDIDFMVEKIKKIFKVN